MAVYYSGMCNKIDNLATDGLAGVSNSLAYRVHGIEVHLHSYERWLCAANVPTGTHKADNVIDAEGVPAFASFQVDAGNLVWGTWVQILGSDDTPVQAGMTKFDPHRIIISASERDQVTNVLQIGYGASGAAALSAGTYTDIVVLPDDSVAAGNNNPVDTRLKRGSAGDLMWARLWIPGQNTGTLDFFLGIHEYVG